VKELAYLNPYLWKHKWKLILGILFVIISNYFQILQPQEVRKSLDTIIAFLQDKNRNETEFYENLFYFGMVILGYALLMGLFMFFMRQTIIVMSREIEYDLREDIFKHYTTLDPHFFKENKTGDMMARIVEDVSKVRMYLGPAIMYAVNILTLTLMTVYSMFSVNAKLAFWSLLPLPILSITIYFISDIINKQSTKIQKQLSNLNNITQEVFSGIRVVKAYTREREISKYFDKATEHYRFLNLELARTDSFFSPLMFFIIGASTLLTIYLGGLEVMAGRFTTGNIAEFIIYIGKLTWPVTSAGWIASLIQQAAASQKRINEFMNVKSTIKFGKVQEIMNRDITLENVSFTYPGKTAPTLMDLNLKIPSGTKLAIFGRTGSGKTTLVDLLVRQYDPSEGKIMIGGIELSEMSNEALRKTIAIAPQDGFLFSEKVKNNIIYPNTNRSQDNIEQFARQASIHEEILQLPNGYDTMIGERGVTLSGGQKQRIGIARALSVAPKVLILDDSLSAVDAKTEFAISQTLNDELNDQTLICCTHRIYQNIKFDNIIVIDGGKIVQEGTHEQLINEPGFYQNLWQSTQN